MRNILWKWNKLHIDIYWLQYIQIGIIEKQHIYQPKMFRSIPIANKICYDKELKRSWEIHEKKLRQLKTSLDVKKPPEFEFLSTRPKKQALREFRNIEIGRQNKVLLSKICSIANEGNISKMLKKPKSAIAPLSKSLNEPYRKRELIKIVEENQAMLRRIQQKKSSYDIRQLRKERENVQQNINLISLYPYKSLRPNKTQVNLWMTNQTPIPYEDRNSLMETQQNSKMDIPLDAKKTRKMGETYYLITSKTQGRKFLIILENIELEAEKYTLEIDIKQARHFVHHYFNDDIEQMLDSLCVDEKQKTCYLKYTVARASEISESKKIGESKQKELEETAEVPAQQKQSV